MKWIILAIAAVVLFNKFGGVADLDKKTARYIKRAINKVK